MNPLSLKNFSFAKILNSTGLLVLVLLWTDRKSVV